MTKSSSSFLLVAGFVSSDSSMSRYDIANYRRLAHPGPGQPRQRRRQLQRVRHAIRDAHLARPEQAEQLRADAGRREQRHHGAERAGLGGRSSAARRQCPASSCSATITRSHAAAHTRGVRQYPAEGRTPTARRFACGDVARIELGAENYNFDTPLQRPACRPASASSSRTGANALRHRDGGARADRRNCQPYFPHGLEVVVSRTTRRRSCKLSIEEVVKTLLEGDRAGVPGHVPVPAEPPRDADPDDRRAGGAARHVRRHGARRASRSTRCRCSAWCWRSACWSTTRSSWSRTSSA